ncbi:MAG: hypothetical protein QOD29_1828 [Alphaproteobacteria bacterium]|jgi:hypothetical protein|nr:hypothetical protein [Alphaproteobacteria bacterium]
MKSARPEDEALNGNEQKTPPENGKGAANPGAAASAPATAPGTDRPAIPTPAGQTATFRYVDRPELVETFADSITGMFFDGQSLRIELAVSRVDEIKANTPITGRRYPACRLVLPPVAAMELINRMQQIGAAMAKAGLLKSPEAPKT